MSVSQATTPYSSAGERARSIRPWLSLTVLFASMVSADHPQEEALVWLEKMSHATRTINYDGTFVYRIGDALQTMRVLHRVDDDGEKERLVSLTGLTREVLRENSEVTCLLPDERAVRVGKRPPRALNRGLDFNANFANNYHLSMAPGGIVAGRSSKLVILQPRDDFRYGYRIALDEESALLLKLELLGSRGVPREQIVYTSLRVNVEIPDELLQPAISSEGYELIADTTSVAEAGASVWYVTWLPDGFELYERSAMADAGHAHFEHQVYSDGLASFSVFIEQMGEIGKPLRGVSTMGAVSAFGRVVDAHQVTVVGEVPVRTVERVGEYVEHRPN